MSDESRRSEAEEVPGPIWSAPRQRTTVYPYTRRPRLRLYTAGAWRTVTVTSRHTHPDGRTSVSCEVQLPDGPDGVLGTFHRAFWWNPNRMRVLWDGRTA